MKISKRELQQLIKEEINQLLSEVVVDNDPPMYDPNLKHQQHKYGGKTQPSAPREACAKAEKKSRELQQYLRDGEDLRLMKQHTSPLIKLFRKGLNPENAQYWIEHARCYIGMTQTWMEDQPGQLKTNSKLKFAMHQELRALKKWLDFARNPKKAGLPSGPVPG